MPCLDDARMAKKPRIFLPQNPLAAAIDASTGVAPRQLLAEADQRVADLGPRLREFVTARLERLLRFASETDDALYAESRTISGAALEVAEVAGAAGMTTIGEIARGISALVDNLLGKGAWHGDALRLHLQAMALASQAAQDALPEDKLMLDRLQTMRKVLGVTE